MFTFNGFLAKLKTKFSTNKTPTNNHRFPLVLPDGTPDGNATPAGIMQFLGALEYKGYRTGVSFNTITERGLYWVQNMTDAPEELTRDGFVLEVLVMGTTTAHIVQRLTAGTTTKNTFYHRTLNGEIWGPWIKHEGIALP